MTLCSRFQGGSGLWLGEISPVRGNHYVKDIFDIISPFHGNLLAAASPRVADTYLCSLEVCEERPPNDDAMVLNSTCLIVGASLGVLW